MRAKLFLLSFTIFVTQQIVCAQAIDNTQSFKNINSDRYFRFTYDNDFFSAADRYYTQGVSLELQAPWVKKFPLSKLLLTPGFEYKTYGLSIEQDGYTPTTLSHNDILYGDRPFAACLFLSTFQTSIDPIGGQRFSTIFTTGILGPGAGGKEMQSNIHAALKGNIYPKGWQNQINNDVVLNYQVDYEKNVCSFEKIFSLDADAIGRLGTLGDRAAIGLTGIVGFFDSPFTNVVTDRKNFRVYGYDHPELSVVGYDATLQGGLFNKNNPYTISSANLTRIVFQNRYGLGLVYKRIYLEYFQTYLTKEFSTGLRHKWGGIQIAFAL